jgi:phosphohistidine phosphatase
MELYLLRHGDAQSADAAGGDEQRKLTERGERDTRAIAEALARAGAAPDLILTSPLVRARQSGAILAEVLGVPAEPEDRLGSGFGLGKLQDLCRERSHERLLLVGHEPDLSTLVRDLAGARVKLRTSGLARLDLETVEPGAAVLHWLLAADLLAPA